PEKQPVYIHCAFGKDRTGTMAAIYRLEIDHWTAEEAMQEMEAFGYHNIYRELINFVKSYRPRGYVRGSAPR
ncbi:MAG TPA: tyrosine-protein phosphatase, partial [Planctomycetota bacterium]|nr:tyrosine-protein phosphatase [Planctomycetota bacterium]